MTADRRRILGILAVLLAAQAFSACKVGMRLGSGGEGTAPAVTAAAGAAAAPAAEENPCVSSKCHATILTQKTVHPPAEGCTDCHEASSPNHPVKGEKTFKLINDVPDLCYSCHDEFGKKKTVHAPVEGGECTECHNPHSTAQPHLLKQPVGELCKGCHDSPTEFKNLHGPVADGECTACHNPHQTDTASLLLKPVPGLCLECHSEIDDIIKSAKVSHGALDSDEGCILCHSPHSSNNEKLMLKPVREVCLDCHDGVMPEKATVFHGKDHAGNCANCHTPHGGDLEHLLVAAFPPEPYVPWTDTAFPLCFSCHKRDMVTEQPTSSATNFRDGKKNLHFVHVHNEKKGRSCRFCHSWHGSQNPKLIQDSVPFGKWTFSLKYVKTETGGGCAPACHKPQYYDRDTPGRRPAAAPAAVKRGWAP